ncbi:MAG: hypothetical protein IJZ10_08590 [Thermoguttaceae bacterium]|nr:hypothetical protein [Thermoguttaceae bacterium]
MDFDDAVPEDLTLLPVGFYDYFAPLLTGLLVDGVNWDGKPWIAGKSVALDRSKKPGDDVGNDEFTLDGKTGASVFYDER